MSTFVSGNGGGLDHLVKKDVSLHWLYHENDESKSFGLKQFVHIANVYELISFLQFLQTIIGTFKTTSCSFQVEPKLCH